jgi:hypothetical protein
MAEYRMNQSKRRAFGLTLLEEEEKKKKKYNPAALGVSRLLALFQKQYSRRLLHGAAFIPNSSSGSSKEPYLLRRLIT